MKGEGGKRQRNARVRQQAVRLLLHVHGDAVVNADEREQAAVLEAALLLDAREHARELEAAALLVHEDGEAVRGLLRSRFERPRADDRLTRERAHLRRVRC